MLDNVFTSSPGLWSLLIAGAVLLPVLIHLINLVRYRRVPFAAMEFLLQSQKQSRSYVWLKQLLLLLARIAMLLVGLLLMAQAGCHQDRIAQILAGRSTHHYVLIDDSLSMTDTGATDNGTTLVGRSAFDHAKDVLSLISGRVTSRQNQKFSMLRFSRAADAQASGRQTGGNAPPAFDMENLLVDSLFQRRLEEVKGQLSASHRRVTLDAAIDQVATLAAARDNENPVVYVLSDFRQTDWDSQSQRTESVAKAFEKIAAKGGAVELINCTKVDSHNLYVSDVRPRGNVRVAATPLMMEMTIANPSDTDAQKVRVRIVSETFSEASSPVALVRRSDDLPTIFIDSIAAGETVTRTFPVYFSNPGSHVVRVRCPDDAIMDDNERSCVVDIKQSSRVLLIDDANQRHSTYLKLALNPGSMTGIEPVREPASFLRDHDADPQSVDSLSNFDAIYLLDIEALDDKAVRNLEDYCRGGGGVVFFLGPKTNLAFWNSLYQNGEGIFPLEIAASLRLEELTERVPDIVPREHPIFAPVLNQKTSLLDYVTIEESFTAARTWTLDPANDARVMATIRGDANRPLLVEARFGGPGGGRTVVCLTTAGTAWNNWARNATYLPVMLLLQDYVAAGQPTDRDRNLSQSIVLSRPADTFNDNLRLLSPMENSDQREQTDLRLQPTTNNQTLAIELPTFSNQQRANLELPGVYDLWLSKKSGDQEVRRVSMNTDPVESDPQRVDVKALLSSLAASRASWVDYDQFNPEPENQVASSLSRLFLVLMVGLLLAEPALAMASSFHHR